MRALKILFITLAVLIAVTFIAGAIFIKTFNVNRYKGQIIAAASQALNRQVDFTKMDLGISLKGINLNMKNFVIADDPAFTKDSFLVLKNIYLSVDLLKYVFKKEVNFPAVVIDGPAINIIRKKDGAINAATIAAQTQTPQAQKPEEIPKQPAKPDVPEALPPILILEVKIINGTLTYTDQSFEPPLRLDINDLSVQIPKIILGEPFPFTAEGAVLSAKKNIRMEGKAMIDPGTNEITITGLKGATELSDIVLEKIPVAFPMTKGAVLPAAMKGKVELALNKLAAGPKGLIALAGDIRLSNGLIQFKEIASPINAAANLSLTEDKVVLNKAAFSIGEGKINASGDVADYMTTQVFNIQGEVKNLALKDILAEDKLPVKAQGLVSGTMKLNGKGFSPDALKTALIGEGNIDITQAKLKDINILRTVLDKISIIPGLGQKVEEGLPENYKTKLTEKDTLVRDAKFPFLIESGRIVIKDTNLGADDFIFNGKGDAGLDGSYTLDGVFLISKELSGAMVGQVKQLQYLLDEAGRLYLPLKIYGKGGAPKVAVDLEYIGKKILVNQAEQQLLKVLNPQSDQQNPEGKKKPSAEDILGGILGDILKGNEQPSP